MQIRRDEKYEVGERGLLKVSLSPMTEVLRLGKKFKGQCEISERGQKVAYLIA